MNTVIGITGGIGAGKSVVSRVLRLRGYHVYDCDLQARLLMDADEEFKQFLCREVGDATLVRNNVIDRHLLAEIIFSDVSALAKVNAKVHTMVRADIQRVQDSRDSSRPLFVESAIMVTAALDRMCAEIWLVQAPEPLRLERVMLRGGISAEDAHRRMLVQQGEFDSLPRDKVRVIINDGSSSLIERIDGLLK